MKKKTRLIIGLSLIVTLFSGCSYNSSKGNKVYTEKDMTHFFSDKIAIGEIKKLDIQSNYADFEIIASDDYYVEYSYYYINNEPTFLVEDETLTFSDDMINTGTYSINQSKDNYFKLYVPLTNELDEVEIEKSSGDCLIGNLNTKELSINNRYGNTIISDCQVNDFDIYSSSGSLTIENSSMKNCEIEDAYGDVNLTKMNAVDDSMKWMKVTSSSGNVNISELYCDDFRIFNSYGEDHVSSSYFDIIECEVSSGNLKCEDVYANDYNIRSQYGKVELQLLGQQEDYTLDIGTKYSTIQVNSKVYENNVYIENNVDNRINVFTVSGDVVVNFKEK